MNEPESAADRELGNLLRAGATHHTAPATLRAGIRQSLRAQDAYEAHVMRDIQRATVPAPRFRWWPVVMAFACGALATWLVLLVLPGANPQSTIETEVLDAHVRSVMFARAIDVASSDQHTVKPWLSARLDFSPPVHDLAADGFPLAGGRVDYVGGRPVAALVYKRHEHWINVFVWPDGRESATATPGARNGFNTISFGHSGMRYWLVSDVGAADLTTFANALQARIAGPT